MRQPEEFFGPQELVLLYIGKRLAEAQRLEAVLDAAGIDYLIELDTYRGGFLFVNERTGAFFYTTEEQAGAAREAMSGNGFRPFQVETGQRD
jgi:hypothetical protein